MDYLKDTETRPETTAGTCGHNPRRFRDVVTQSLGDLVYGGVGLSSVKSAASDQDAELYGSANVQ